METNPFTLTVAISEAQTLPSSVGSHRSTRNHPAVEVAAPPKSPGVGPRHSMYPDATLGPNPGGVWGLKPLGFEGPVGLFGASGYGKFTYIGVVWGVNGAAYMAVPWSVWGLDMVGSCLGSICIDSLRFWSTSVFMVLTRSPSCPHERGCRTNIGPCDLRPIVCGSYLPMKGCQGFWTAKNCL